MSRILGIVRTLSLENHAEGWTKDCFITYKLATRRDYMTFKAMKTDGMSDDEGLEYMYSFVKSHCAVGKVMAYVDNTFQVVDFEADDVDDFDPDLVKRLFLLIVGRADDPKVTDPAPSASALRPSDLHSETPSSTKPS